MGLINDASGAIGGAAEHVSGSLGCSVKFDTASIPSQSGKVILITGGTSLSFSFSLTSNQTSH